MFWMFALVLFVHTVTPSMIPECFDYVEQEGTVRGNTTVTSAQICTTADGFDVDLTFEGVDHVLVEETFPLQAKGEYQETTITYPSYRYDRTIDVWVNFQSGDGYYAFDLLNKQWYEKD